MLFSVFSLIDCLFENECENMGILDIVIKKKRAKNVVFFAQNWKSASWLTGPVFLKREHLGIVWCRGKN
jgi:hypothetical protein